MGMKKKKKERGKDEEKIMFPRLHVNDASKGGGPRAPPRNKMALYEHLSVPSHRYTHSNPNPYPSSTQGGVTKLDEDEFRVPVFVHSAVPNQECDRDSPLKFQKPQNSTTDSTLEKLTHLSEPTNNSIAGLSTAVEDQNNTESRLERAESGVTETDSISRLYITPDDVAGVIGQKRFWKARRAIANQHRVFAIQVFELHRLVKVQRLLAASPNLLIEGSAYLGKLTKTLPRKKIPLNPQIKEIPNFSKQIDESEKPSQKNTVGKPSNDNSPAPSVNPMPWCFSQPQQGQQLLIPVMSPTEGLIYKPYPAPNSGTGNVYPPACGISAPHQPYHPPSIPHAYFPQYGMPVMNNPAAFSGSSVEQMNARSEPSNVSSGNQNMPMQPSHNNQALNVSEDREVQASTASGPADRMQESRASSSMEGRNMLSLFSTSPALEASKEDRQPTKPECPTQVIKVVPHNAASATESAARIFRCIQEERRRYYSMQVFLR